VKLSFHRLIHGDLRSVLGYYTQEAGPDLAARFLGTFDRLVARIAEHPALFSPVAEGLRRANMPEFPYHLLFRETPDGVRILVLRHHKRSPCVGRDRR
jgi:plasmid stabilization system protein ParE